LLISRLRATSFHGPRVARSWQLVALGVTGAVHAANGGLATWYDVAHRVFTHAGAAECLSRCSTTEYPTRVACPAYSVLDTGLLENSVGTRRSWTDGLDRFLRELERSVA
jgi:dTDP-4-dehydrorhamnose reductase